VLTLLNKIFLTKQIIEARSTRFEKNFEHLTERNNDFREDNLSIRDRIDDFECDSIRDLDIVIHDFRFEILINDLDETAHDFSVDFVEYLLCVSRIDRDDFFIMIQSFDDFEHLNKFERSKMIQMLLKL
jgi:hypothetical protein